MWLKAGVGTLVVLSVISLASSQDTCGPAGCRLSRYGTYFVTAPRIVHPNQEYNVFVSILNMFYQQINVRVAIKRYDEDVIAATRMFTSEGFAIVPLLVPANASPGNYTLRLEGQEIEGVAGFIFENETALEFDTKQLSVYIQTNKPLYRQGQKVSFRVFPVEKNLMSRSGSLDVMVRDATGTIVRRWISQQTNAGGVLDLSFDLAEQPSYGTWAIEVSAWGHIYSKSFDVNEFFVTAIDVNVSMPLYHSVDEFGLAGIVMANLSLGQPAKGTCQVFAEIRLAPGDRDPDVTYEAWPTLTKETRYFPGMTDFLFTMDELEETWRDFYDDYATAAPLYNKEIYVQADVYDWFLHQGAYGSAITIIYDNLVTVEVLGDTSRSFKPNQAFVVYLAVMHTDGTPLRYFRRQVTINLSITKEGGSTRSEETKVLTPDDGIIKFTWWPEFDDERLRLTSFYDNIQTRFITLDAHRHYTQTRQFISLTTSTTQPSVDKYMVFTVVTTTFVDDVYFLVASAGNIVTGGQLFMQSHQKTFSLSVSRDMIPEAHLLVWYLYKGEIVSDSLNFYVNGTRINSAEISFNRGKDFTGDTVEVTGRTDPSSFIGASVLDYELWSYGWNSLITEVDMIRELWTFDTYGNKSFFHTWRMPHEQEQMVHYAASSYAVDSNRTFEFAGLLVFSDANITKRPSACNETLGDFPCMDGNCYHISQWCDGTRQCLDGQDEMGCPPREIQRFTPARERLGLLTRHYVMVGEWLWGGHFVMPNGRIDFIVDVPDEPMSWVLGGFAISRNLGFGIIHSPPRHQATRAFYMRAEAPYRVKKGEMIGIRLGLFNYWQEDLECLVTLHDSEQYRFVIVEEFGIVSSYAPRTIRGNMQTMIYLRRGRVYEMLMPVLPVVDGCLEVTVSAFTFLYTDTEVMELCTEYDGVTNYLHTPYFVDMISSGSLTLPDLEIPVPERFVIPEQRNHLYVPGSQKATVGIVGDVVGPGFFEDFLDAENTLRKPFGGAEQNMYNFAYNLYNLLYLKLTDQQDLTRLRSTLDHMNIALQRQMGYMNEDGSFSMFRDYQEYTPSTWVSAFVLRTLQDANQKDWEIEYFFIPGELLNKIALWLCTQQDSSGAFHEQAPLYDRKQWSNYTTDENGNYRTQNMSLTAYVLITFQQVKLTGQAEICKQSAITPARNYLSQRALSIEDPYTMAIVTYALYITGSDEASDAFSRLRSMRRTNSLTYWAQKEVLPNDVRYEDTFTFYQPRVWYDNEGYAVEATSYALLTYMLNRADTSETRPIMEWLQNMRNTYAGQASTQDTITALIALTEYAKNDNNRDIYNILFDIQATSMDNVSQPVHIRKGSWAEQQYAYVNPVWGSVRGTSNGTGIALMQLATQVNVEYIDQIMPIAFEHYFNVSIVDRYEGRNASIMHATVCAKWDRPDISERSGLTVVEAHIPTGYVITNDVLRAYAQSGDVPTLRRAEAYDRKVVFYFDYLSSNESTCVTYRTDRWYPVSNMTRQHLLRVFDYYEPGMHNTTLFTTFSLTALHMCQVCGSFQCPYCPYYNQAPNTLVPFSLLFISLVTLAIAYLSKRFTNS